MRRDVGKLCASEPEALNVRSPHRRQVSMTTSLVEPSASATASHLQHSPGGESSNVRSVAHTPHAEGASRRTDSWGSN